MVRVAAFTLALIWPMAAWAQSDDEPYSRQSIDRLPGPATGLDNGQTYAPPVPTNVVVAPAKPGPGEIGPAQKHFALASHLDHLVDDPNAPVVSAIPSEKVSLDRRIRVPLVHDVQNDSTFRGGHNDAILFEIKYLDWGAVTGIQYLARYGHYFTITFVNGGPTSDFLTRFEYRQVNTKAVVRSLEQKKVRVSGAARAYFAVVGTAYTTYGPVSSWRFTVLRGDTVVAEAKSFLW